MILTPEQESLKEALGKYKKGEKLYRCGGYWNCGKNSVAIVAVITWEVDWAAYIGDAPNPMTEEEAIIHIAYHGTKLSRRDAEHFFENMPFPWRR